MPVAIAQQQRKREEPKKDPLDDVLKGLQVVSGALNVTDKIQKIDEFKKQNELAEQARIREQEGIVSTPGLAKSFQGDQAFTPTQEEIDRGALVQTARVEAPGPVTEEGVPAFTEEQFITGKERLRIDKERKLEEKAEADRVRLADKEKGEREKQLRKEFNSFTAGKETAYANKLEDLKTVADLYSKNKITTSDDIAVINKFARLLSPGIVTTQDFDNIKRTGGYPEEVQAYIARIRGEGELTPEQRREVLATVERMALSPSQAYQRRVDEYVELAKRNDADVDDVVTNSRRNLVKNVMSGFEDARKNLGIPTQGTPQNIAAQPAARPSGIEPQASAEGLSPELKAKIERREFLKKQRNAIINQGQTSFPGRPGGI
jgi:hypothetical protein